MTLARTRKEIATSVVLVAGLALWLALAGAAADAAPRLALVVGNGGYDPANITRLDNPVNDARLMASTLETVGFEVSLVTDADREAMNEAIEEFGKRLRVEGRDAVGLFYYAGHGVEAKGRNYLIPLGAEIGSELEFQSSAVRAQYVLDWMEYAGNRLNMLILDACRDNPYGGKRGGKRGLERMDAPSGSLIAYAAGPGKTATDGDGENSPYTLALAQTLVEPGLKVEEVFKRVRIRVEEQTGEDQTPWENTSLKGDFYFVPADDNDDTERTFWDSIKNSRNPVKFRAYLEKYGEDGEFAALARIELEALEGGGGAVDEDPGPVAGGVREDANEGSKVDGNAVIAQRMAAERVFWESIMDSEDPAYFDDYLDRYPGGEYEKIARRHRDKLLVAADDAAYARADSLGTSAAYSEYLESYPSGRNVKDARERLKFTDLLGRKFSTDVVDESGWTDLHYAAVMNLPRVADALLKAGMNVDVRLAEDGRAFGDRLKAHLHALEYDIGGWNGWNGEANGETPLLVAVRQDARPVAKLLIERGADVNAKRGYGETALFYAARWNAPEVARLLIERGADPNAEHLDASGLWFSFDGLTPLHWAAKANSRDVAELLIDHGADIQAKEPVGWTTLHLAADVNAIEVAELLITRGADLNAKDSDGATPLMHAPRGGDREMARLLIEHGAEVTLSYAAVANDRELAQKLIERGAHPNVKDDTSGNTPLHHAAESGAFEVAELLIDRGASIDAKNKDGRTPLMETVVASAGDVAELLVNRGAIINDCCDVETALHLAAYLDRSEMAQLLLERGADFDLRNKGGSTPLHLAAYTGSRNTAELLINHGANVNAENNYGQTPLDKAARGDYGEHTELVDLIRSHGGRCATSC